MQTTQPDPSHIMQVGMGFWASKTLLSAVELGLFSLLAKQPAPARVIEDRLRLHPRATADFLDALVALGFVSREGDGADARYANTPDTQQFLDKASPHYIGGILEMANARLYQFWSDLTPALQTGTPQNEIKHTGSNVFEALYADPPKLEGFMNAMAGISMGSFHALAQRFDFSKYRTMLDVGGATGQLSLVVAGHHPQLSITSFDLPPVEPIAKRHIAAAGLAGRVTTASGDFFRQPLPEADVITMGMILHNWNLENKMSLLRSAYAALPSGGALVVIENLIDDARRENAFGLLMSLNMLIEFGDAFDFTGADFDRWCRDVGFARTEVIHLAGPASAAIAHKA